MDTGLKTGTTTLTAFQAAHGVTRAQTCLRELECALSELRRLAQCDMNNIEGAVGQVLEKVNEIISFPQSNADLGFDKMKVAISACKIVVDEDPFCNEGWNLLETLIGKEECALFRREEIFCRDTQMYLPFWATWPNSYAPRPEIPSNMIGGPQQSFLFE